MRAHRHTRTRARSAWMLPCGLHTAWRVGPPAAPTRGGRYQRQTPELGACYVWHRASGNSDLVPRAVSSAQLRDGCATEGRAARRGGHACVGHNEEGQCSVPADLGPVLSMAAGFEHTWHVWLAGRPPAVRTDSQAPRRDKLPGSGVLELGLGPSGLTAMARFGKTSRASWRCLE